MKIRRMHFIAVVIILVLCISVCTTTTSAAVVWSDNFDDGLDDWTIFAHSNPGNLTKIEGNFTDADDTLKVLDDDLNYAWHNSTVNVGTWSFDMYIPDVADDFGVIYVYIMSNGSRPIPMYPSDFIAVGAWKPSSAPAWSFIVWSMHGLDHPIHASFVNDPMQGWHHIEISRTNEGHFCIWINGTAEAHFTYNAVTTSTYLEFYCYSTAGAAIDNLTVDDIPKPCSFEHTTTTTTTTTATTTSTDGMTDDGDMTTLLIVTGVGIAVVVIVLVVFVKRR